MAGRQRLLRALRKVEEQDRAHHKGTLKMSAGTALASPFVPGASAVMAGLAFRELLHEKNVGDFMRKWGKKLERNQPVAQYLAQQAKPGTHIKKELEKIAWKARQNNYKQSPKNAGSMKYRRAA